MSLTCALPALATLTCLRRAVAVCALLLAGASWAAPVDRFAPAGTDEASVGHFLTELQQAVQADDRAAVLRLFSCPCRVWDGSKTRRLGAAKDVLPLYGAVFDAQLRQLIVGARKDALFANAQGVMIGDGRLWFAPVGPAQALRIITINPPMPTPAGK